jgi:hypothetical protein
MPMPYFDPRKLNKKQVFVILFITILCSLLFLFYDNGFSLMQNVLPLPIIAFIGFIMFCITFLLIDKKIEGEPVELVIKKVLILIFIPILLTFGIVFILALNSSRF